jgi:ABC-2 type transport system permease protein
MWLRIGCLIIKELLAVWRDPKSRFLLIAPPMIEMLIFANAATQEVKNVRIAVFNQDMGIHARDLIARFEGSPNFREVRHLFSQRSDGGAIWTGFLAAGSEWSAGQDSSDS